MSTQGLLGGAAGGRWSGTLPSGAAATLTLHTDGSVGFEQDDIEPSSGSGWLSMCLPGGPATVARVAALDVVGASIEGSSAVQVWHMPLQSTGNLIDARKPVRELRKTPPLQLASPREAAEAVAEVRRACCAAGSSSGGARRLVVIINPASGPGRAQQLFHTHVQPVLDAAGIEITLHVTKRQGHATELVRQLQPGAAECLVAVGGDGTVFEFLQGLLQRPDWDSMRSTPMAQVPCGSGNALAASTGLWDVHTAAHALVKGAASALDIASVVQPPARRCFSFLSLTYGLIPRVDIGTEALRWMGGARFTVGAVHETMMQRTFALQVAYLEAPAEQGSGVAAGIGQDLTQAGAATGSVQVGSRADGGEAQAVGGAAATGSLAGDRLVLGEGPPLRHGAALEALCGHAELATAPLPPGWRRLECGSEIQIFALCNLPMLDTNFHFAPHASASSGYMNLIYTPGKLGRVRGLKLLTAAETGAHMPLVQQQRLVAMAMEPLGEGTWVVVDGEAAPHRPVYLEVHPSLCMVVGAPPAADP